MDIKISLTLVQNVWEKQRPILISEAGAVICKKLTLNIVATITLPHVCSSSIS
jgi:hypothetical protein